MHQQVEDTTPRATVITDDTTKAELEQALTEHVRTLQRMPAHWADRRAALHAKLDAMLTDWEQAPDGGPEVPDA